MIAINWTPNARELRQFSIALLVFTVAVGGVLWWQIGPNRISQGFWIAGPILAVLGLVIPPAIRPVFIGLTLLAFPIGYVISFIALALIYYLLITPVGLFGLQDHGVFAPPADKTRHLA